VISQKSWDSVTVIMMLLLLLVITAALTQLVIGGTIFGRFSDLAYQVVNILFGITIVLMIVVLVLENDNPIRTLAWILVLLYIPVVGFFFYLFFGRNWRKTRLFNRKGLSDAVNLDELPAPWGGLDSGSGLSELQEKLVRLLEKNSKSILTQHNEVRIVADTNQALDLICADIERAERHVHLEYFSIARDAAGQRIKDLLVRKARQGVEVRFIYDDVGCWNLGAGFKAEMREAGVSFVPFMPVWVPFLNSRLNYRNHRKLVIVDGRRGYLGGLNIGNKYLGRSRYFGYWRDSLVKLRGESVQALQAIFLTDWFFVSKQNLLTPELFRKYTPPPDSGIGQGRVLPVQVTASGPDTDHASIMQVFFSAIANARESVRIASPYLILNESLLMALKTAAFSGVKVQIIVPGKADHLIVFWGSKSYYRELLEAGIEIYEYGGGFMHSKVLIADNEVLSIGTANMDLRSFNHNFEITALIYDREVCAQALEHFSEDLARSQLVDLEAFKHRSIFKKGVESICRLFSPLL
jgi:cardiolipin synthase